MSIHLPVDRRRICLSAVELLSSDYSTMAEGYKSPDKSDTECIAKADAIEKVQLLCGFFKNKLDRHVNPDEEAKISTQLDIISNEAISRLTEKQLKSDLQKIISGIFKEMFRQTLFENPLVIQQPDHAFSKEDFQIAEMPNYGEYVSNKRVSYCYDFTFYQLNEEKAFPYMFNSDTAQWPADFFKDSLNFLASWGYEETKAPSPGDLVLYRYKGMTQHWGIWTHDNTVLSKLGMSYVVKHPVGDVVLGYGDDVYFFRKRIKSSLLRNFIDVLDKTHQSLSDSTHSIVDSTLSTSGFVKRIIELFETMKLAKIFKNNIYNVDYNNDLRRETLLTINAYYLTVSDFTPKDEVIETIKNLVFSVSVQAKRQI
jgi:hypothetical protein